MVTKGEVCDFFDSFLKEYNGEFWRMEDTPLRSSLVELGEILNTYFLFDKPKSYALKEWEYNYCFKMGDPEFKPTKKKIYCNLEPYFLPYKRNKQLESIEI